LHAMSSSVIKHTAEIIERALGECIAARSIHLDAHVGLGPADLCHLTKVSLVRKRAAACRRNRANKVELNRSLDRPLVRRNVRLHPVDFRDIKAHGAARRPSRGMFTGLSA
jgi:hypothetical protein